MKVCLVEDCEKPVQARGWCAMHLSRWYRYGDLTTTRRVQTWAGQVCTFPHCGLDVESKGWCSKHYKRVQIHGDVNVVLQGGRQRKGCLDSGGYMVIMAPEHPVAATNGMAKVHRMVLFDAIGRGEHPCHWCGRMVSWDARYPSDPQRALVVDHLDFNRTNNDLANLVPSCQPCNFSRRPEAAG